jgi:hypothetical protein
MKSRSMLGLAVAAALACSTAAAGGIHHTTETLTPSAVNEGAPWLAHEAHGSGWTSSSSSRPDDRAGDTQVLVENIEYWRIGEKPADEPAGIGASSTLSGSGTVGFDSQAPHSSNR